MHWFRQTLRTHRVIILTVLAINVFYMVEGARFVEARQLRLQEEERRLEEFSLVFDIPLENLRGDEESVFEPIKKLVTDEVGPAVEAGYGRLRRIVRQAKDRALSDLSRTKAHVEELTGTTKKSLSSFPQAQIVAAFPQERPSPIQTSETERVSRAPRSRERSASSLGASGEMPLPLRRVEKKVRTEEAVAPVGPRAKSTARVAPPVPRQVIPKDGIAPEIVALAESLGNSPAEIFSRVHDSIDFDPKWGVHRSPLGTLHEGRGTAWDQAWLLQQLLTAAGVDARFQWGEIEIPTAILLNLTGVEDPWQAGNLMTTAGVPIVLMVQGSQVLSARISHVWLTAYIDFIPNRGITPGPGDYWVRMDPTLKRFAIADGVRLDDQVPFDLGEYLQSGTPFAPRQVYEEALQAHITDNNLGITLEEVKPSKTVIQDAFPFVPGTLRGRILTFEGESPEVPAAFQQQLDLEIRAAGGSVLATWSTPWSAVSGQRLEVAWTGATTADQAALDLYGGVFATPPYEIDLKPVIRVDGLEVAAGSAIGSAEDVVLLATITPSQGSPTVMQFELLAGEHGVFTVDFGQMPQEVIDHCTQELNSATDPLEQEAWTLALAGALYQRLLSGDLEHLAGLRWQRLVQLGTAVLAIQRGAVSTAPDGTPLTFSKGPMSLDLGAMPLGLFPATGAAGSTVPTLELLGSQGSLLEGEALSQVIGGEQITAVTFLTRAVREGQTLTLVDAGNVDAALAGAELSAEAAAHVRAGVEQGKIAWIAESQLPVDTWQTSGYILEDPGTGAGGYFVTFERLVEGLEANIVFHSPQDLEVVTAPIDVVATIEGEAVDSWTLSYKAVGNGQPVVLATGSESVTNATLVQFDPTLLLNGLYDIVLTGRDIAGQSVSEKISVSVEGNMKVGNFSVTFVDLETIVSGLNLSVTRTYDSRDLAIRDFGIGWTLGIRQGSYTNNRKPGQGWEISGGFLPCEVTRETLSHSTLIRISDTEIYHFRLALVNGSPIYGGCFAEARFDFVDGRIPGAKLEILGNTSVIYQNGSSEVIDVDTLEVYEPQAVQLTTRDGRIFDLDLDRGVTRLADLHGNSLTITPEGVIHSSGREINFERDGEGRIVALTDPEGNVTSYTYNGNGDLATVTNPENHTTGFTYDSNHYLLEFEDSSGNKPVRNDYDDGGRIIRHTDAFGKVICFNYNLATRREIITDRLGHSRLFEYDPRGNVIREIDTNGRATVRSFDDFDNLIMLRDPAGNTTHYEYNQSNNLIRFIDALSNVTSHTYNSRGQILTTTDPRGNITKNEYDENGNLISITGPSGNITYLTYDSRGNLTTVIDPEGGTTQYSYDTYGHLVQEIDPLGNEILSTYDGNGNRLTQTKTRTTSDGSVESLISTYVYNRLGRLTKITDPDGATRTIKYDNLDRLATTTNKMGQTTTYIYDVMGRLTGKNYPDGTTEEQTFDAEGRHLTVTDRGGRTTTYHYDPAGNLLEVTDSDGTTVNTYDDAGNILTTTDTRGNTTTYLHDAAGRQIGIIDALGNQTLFGYDANGNRTTVTDARGQTKTTVYDARNLPVRIIFPDGTEKLMAYDRDGRRTSETDQAGRTNHFTYSAIGQLTKVTEALGQETIYSYDEVGNLNSFTDANGNIYRFEYDQAGRITKQILPQGLSGAMSYDTAGNLVSRMTFNGDTISLTYDTSKRLIRRDYPDGTTESFTYRQTGQRLTATDGRGTTLFTYDDKDRMTSVTYPDGRILTYTYDSEGNRTSVTAIIDDTSLTTSYTYDALNRLHTVTDPEGGHYTYSYDANGNRASLAYPNSIETAYSYDSQDRLTDLTTCTEIGDVVQSYAFTLDMVGNRTRIDEYDGTVREYSYDALYRLTREAVNDSSGLLSQRSYSYDPVGNRLSQEIIDNSGTTALSYTYDTRDRLLNETGIDYTWNNNGNLITKSGTDGAIYLWDYNNRLIQVTKTDGIVVKYTYGADGNRVRTEITPANGPPTITDYLVDVSGSLSQVVAETNQAGNLTAYYVRGDELLGVLRNGSTRFYHADGLGTIRRLTDAAGNITDNYTFSSFGELVSHIGSDYNTYLYAGESLDPNSGFYYNRARWLDPRNGRFLSVDPFQGLIADPPSLHKYNYVANNPVNDVDPSGQFSGDALSALVSTVVQNMLVGALIGAFFGALEGAFNDEVTIAQGVLNGMLWGALLGPLGRVRHLQKFLFYMGTVIAGWGTYSAFVDGDIDLALYRGVLFVAGPFGAMVSGKSIVTGNTTIYQATNMANTGRWRTVYVGITRQLLAGRQNQHNRGPNPKNIVLRPIRALRSLSTNDVRAVEQALIEMYGLGGKPGQTGRLMNKINSIAPTRPAYAQQLRRGFSLLLQAGWPFFV